MPSVDIKVTISGGTGKVIVTRHEYDDIEITSSSSTSVDMNVGRHFVMVYGRPPVEGYTNVEFIQGSEVIASHKYKSPSSIPFQIEVE